MSDHAKVIMAKWVEVASQLSSSGLRNEGVERVFLKQFSQEDTLSNVQLVTSARSIKDQLINSQVSGTERVTPALMVLFSAYAGLCERDRTPSADPADFIRDLHTKYEFFAVALIVFADQLIPFAERINEASQKKP